MPRRRGKHEGYPYRRTDGLYCFRLRFEGRLYQVSSMDRRERDRLARELRRDLEAGTPVSTLPRKKTLAAVVAEWLADRALTRPATYPTWRSYARHLTEGPLAGVVVSRLEPAEVTAFLTAKQRVYAPSTVRQIHRTLQAALNWAVGAGVPVPATVLRMTAPAVADVDRVQLTPAQVGRLFRSLAARDDPLAVLWVLMWYTAARLGELLALTWDEVNRVEGEVGLVRILVKTVDGEPRVRAGKTKQSRAVMAIPPSAVEALWRHWRRQEERRAIVGDAWRTPAIGRLVVDRGDGGALRHEQAEQALYEALEAAGLPRCRPHDLRGAALSALREAGHDVLDVQRRARHASVQTTLGSYVRGTDAADRRAAETLERLVAEDA